MFAAPVTIRQRVAVPISLKNGRTVFADFVTFHELPDEKEHVALVFGEIGEEPLVRLGEEVLAGLGYEPVGFTSSVAALQSLRAAPARFDLVLSDEAMPEMTGSELARAIRAIRSTASRKSSTARVAASAIPRCASCRCRSPRSTKHRCRSAHWPVCPPVCSTSPRPIS